MMPIVLCMIPLKIHAASPHKMEERSYEPSSPLAFPPVPTNGLFTNINKGGGLPGDESVLLTLDREHLHKHAQQIGHTIQ